ncbi:MAG TPA: hypothetical protein VFS48_02340 [Solirubrobacterales bacterium]|nr:hypothetical protein [Solirubrobacterales bacterium]
MRSLTAKLCLPAIAVAMGLGAAPAAATFHEISVREVYAGSLLVPDSQYVELQMWSSGQDRVAGHSLKIYNAGGTETATATFAGDVPAGANQSTILIATPAAKEFGVTADLTLAASKISPAGGAVCWEDIDCVSWGNFSGSGLPSPAGSPAAPGGIPSGLALRRTIAPGCPSQLEAGDDHDNSAADFAAVAPTPRPNSVAPSERACPSAGGGSGGSGSGGGGKSDGNGNGNGRRAPQTTLARKPAKQTADRTPSFRFVADEAHSTFQCKLDAKPFKPCRSPLTTKRLSLGLHTFKVRARDSSGKLDPTPATYAFKVVAKR